MDRQPRRNDGVWRIGLASWVWSSLTALGILGMRLSAGVTVPVLTAWSTTLTALSVSLFCLVAVGSDRDGDGQRYELRRWVFLLAALCGPALIGAALIPANHATTPGATLFVTAAVVAAGLQHLRHPAAALASESPSAAERSVDATPANATPVDAESRASGGAAGVEAPECTLLHAGLADDSRQREATSPKIVSADEGPTRFDAETPSEMPGLAALEPASQNAADGQDTASVIPITERTTQWLTRTQLEHGVECIEGAVRVHFAAGQTRAVAHLSFTPPLSCIPKVEVECVDECELRLRLTAIQSYGLRLEAQRRAASRPLTATVAFSALAAQPERHAA